MKNEHQSLAIKANLAIIHSLDTEILSLEKIIKAHIKLRPEFKSLTVNGIGEILGLTIMLETGDIHRFKHVGNYSSYCRCVKSVKLTNGKRKGSGNAKNRNRYLA